MERIPYRNPYLFDAYMTRAGRWYGAIFTVTGSTFWEGRPIHSTKGGAVAEARARYNETYAAGEGG